MTDAEKAYARAQEIIAEAKSSGAHEISFYVTDCRALDTLPPEISELDKVDSINLGKTRVSDITPLAGLAALETLLLFGTSVSDITPLTNLSALKGLYLENTQVSDIAPLANLSALEVLTLSNTQVSNITPLADLASLLDSENDDSVFFLDGIPALEDDAQLADISRMNTEPASKEALRAYFEERGFYDDPVQQKPDPAMPVVTKDGQIESDPAHPEAEDVLKEQLHARLKNAAQTLFKAAGNQFPRLASTARNVLDEAEKPLTEINLINLHLENESLKDWEAAGSEDGMAFPAEVSVPLGDVTRCVPPLTLGDPQVDLIVERINTAKGITPPPDDVARHDAFGDKIKADDAAMGPNLRAIEEKLDRLSNDVALAVQKPLHRNVLVAVAALAFVPVAQDVAKGIMVEALSPMVKTFLATHWQVAAAVAETYSVQFLHWFASAFAQVPELSEQARKTLDYVRSRLGTK